MTHPIRRLISCRALKIVAAGLLLLVLFTFLREGALWGAPVTFRIEALVASVMPTNAGDEFPFTISPGDAINATFTVEPGSPGPIYLQSGNVRFEIGGTELIATGFQVRVAHDEEIGIDVPGRIADPNNTPDVDGGPIGDSIYLSCSEGGSLFCGMASDDANLVFRPTIVFADTATILSSNDLTTELNVWNQFSRREMSIQFRNADTGNDIYYVGAYVGSLSIVPEPSTVGLLSILFCLPVAWISVFRRRRRFGLAR